MRNSNTGLSHGTSGSPQESIESLEYGAKVQEVEAKLKEKLGRLENSKENLSNLSNIECFTTEFIKHLFEGGMNDRGKAVGCHCEGVRNPENRVILGTEILPDKHGVYKGFVFVNGVTKRVVSSFYPQKWAPQQVINAINEAYKNKVNVFRNRYIGDFQGIQIEMYLNPEGKIKSAYPIKDYKTNCAIRVINEFTFEFGSWSKNVVLSHFFEGDFAAFQDQFFQLIDDVLAGKSKSEEITGNSTNVVFQKDITTIENLFLEGEPAFCEISTYELRSLMDVWLQKCVES